ncbi:hypothetical protein BFO_2820 [Tannerella forsythia 92A2]|uniref:Uncharacterized protein n=1 Tax=Tannerella forsythia (strain ATCC 43037 / JCM 10827 / CCUG 21028 A / KCTC 5666 / FDC 338) TaxID=203275 RepID=G8UNA0_TANFA|nr:hypothetical protein BFO_2820 [Tannerella forsythia 92A2]BAR49903.1 hypothetical protein TF3313_2464 [Tannerella forsythia 3313]
MWLWTIPNNWYFLSCYPYFWLFDFLFLSELIGSFVNFYRV